MPLLLHRMLRLFALLLLSSILPFGLSGQIMGSGTGKAQLNAEENKELMPCFDYFQVRENAVWARNKEFSRTYVRKCDWSLSYIVLNPDSTFASIIRTEKANWLQSGRWKMNGSARIQFIDDNALSEEFLCAFNNQKGNLYTIAHLVASDYVYKENHLIPVTTFSLPSESTIASPIPEEDTDLRHASISGNFLHGPNKIPLAGTKVNLLSNNNEVLQTAITNIFGAFLLNNIPYMQDYSIGLQIDDPTIAKENIYFVSKSGKTIGVSNQKLGFKYTVLATDVNTISELAEEDPQLKVDVKGKLFLDAAATLPLIHIFVSLLNRKGEIKQTTRTDTTGLFKFSHKIDKESYSISLSDSAVSSRTRKEIFLADEKGRIVQKMLANNGSFKYELLPQMQSSITQIVLDDPWLDILDLSGNNQGSLVIVENIYYKVNDWTITPEAQVILNKVVLVLKNKPGLKIEMSSHTDSRGSDAANLVLSQKRAEAGVKYLLSQGIAANRLSSKSYGETRLINKCANGVKCSEEEHQKNRRAEFTVFWGK
jgi:outer membrane protein OmpA-like peptidoglycan-associated protein